MTSIAFSILWTETLGFARRHADILAPVAAAFLFLPSIGSRLLLGSDPPSEAGAPALVGVGALLAFGLIGQVAIMRMAVGAGDGDTTVAATLGESVRRFAPALATTLMQSIAIVVGLIAFIVPGLYIMARLSLALPIIAAEQPDPVAALKASVERTRGMGFRILGFLLLLAVAFLLLSVLVAGLGSALGVLASVTGGQRWGVGRWILELSSAAAGSALGLLWLIFLARLSKALAR